MQVHPERPPPAYHWNGLKVSPLTLQPVKRLIFQENLSNCNTALSARVTPPARGGRRPAPRLPCSAGPPTKD